MGVLYKYKHVSPEISISTQEIRSGALGTRA